MEMKLSATSAASSLALLRFLPSYQNLAWWVAPLTVTRLDQAVRPPIYFSFVVSISGDFIFFLSPPSPPSFALPWGRVAGREGGPTGRALWACAGLPLLSETIWNEGEAIWYSRHASV